MPPPSQREVSLEDVLAFNDALTGLAAAGLPIELEMGDANETLRSKLAQLNARLALQVSRGQSLAQVLASDPDVTPRYRAALESWLTGQHPVEALDALSASAGGRREIEATARYSLVYPLIVLALVYVGFIYLLLTVVPKLTAIYAQLAEPPSYVLAALQSARHWLPVWGPLMPLLIAAIAVVFSWAPRPQNLKWLPGRIKYLNAIHKANYADSIARLLEQNHTLGQALALLGPLPTESPCADAYAAATARVIEAEQQGAPVAADDPKIQALPALLRWAFTGDLLGQPLPAVLRIAARSYRAVARRQSAAVRWWLPTLVGSLLGGVFVLAFALSLFWPMVELLRTLTQPLEDIGHAGLRL